MYKKVLLALLALIMTIPFVACAAHEQTNEELGLPSVYEIMLGVTEAQSKISTYQFDMYMNIDATTNASNESFDGTILMGINGAIDLENSQMSMDMNMIMEDLSEDDFSLSMGMYVVDEFMYIMTDIPEMGPMWMKMEMPILDWGEFDQIDSQIELLVDAVEVNVIGSEEIKGIVCYVLEIIPDMEQLWQIAMQQSGITGEEMLPEINEDFISQMFKDFSVTQWIAKDTYLLTKVKIDMNMEVTPEAMGFPGETGSMAMEITIDLFAYDYNQPVSIELPQGAENAIDMPLFSGF